MVLNVLFIDFYDSFTYNLVNLIRDQGEHVTIIHFDSYSEDEIEKFLEELKCFDCIVLGPGPGNPENGFQDVGFMEELFLRDVKIPILGVCLGFQMMCRAAGSAVKQLPRIKHGQVCEVELVDAETANKGTLFAGYPKTFKSVRYHSLHVGSISSANSRIIPLCHTQDGDDTVLMGAQISGKPWYGVQYHPESCCSELGAQLISNFLHITREYNGERTKEDTEKLSEASRAKIIRGLDRTIDKSSIYEKAAAKLADIQVEEIPIKPRADLAVEVCSLLNIPFFLMSSSTIQENRGEFSIIALPNNASTVYTHYDQVHRTTIHKWRDPKVSLEGFRAAAESGTECDGVEVINQDKSEFWKTVGDFMKPNISSNNPELPFIGGIVGVLGYEMGQFTTHDYTGQLVPDAKLVYIENSIIIDYRKGSLYFLSMKHDFPEGARHAVTQALAGKTIAVAPELPADVQYKVQMPARSSYAEAYENSQEYLNKGDSYEVCLTTQTKVTPSQRVEPWTIFRTLIRRNPAPFASFFEFSDIVQGHSDLCLLSTSPERFLKWNSAECELRPIKGTVKKNATMTRELATKILKTPKEFGENLMILDLIRNDLYELLDKVSVEELMSVEEYETVYQLVSVVKGYDLQKTPYSGIDLLHHSLPPGSMTGAPKKNTVELLQNDIEKRLNTHMSNTGARGVYSGVTGYMSNNDRGDWSVNIRCMFSYDNAQSWRLGAGGAVTVLSTLEGEWQEMLAKLESALQVFQDNDR